MALVHDILTQLSLSIVLYMAEVHYLRRTPTCLALYCSPARLEPAATPIR
jgi:hypothetical protein